MTVLPKINGNYLILLLAATEILTNVQAITSVSGSLVTCYRTEEECEKSCSKFLSCQYADHCNYSSYPMHACTVNIFLMLGLIFGGVSLTLLISLISCFCCKRCPIARGIKRRKEYRQNCAMQVRAQAAGQLPPPPPGYFQIQPPPGVMPMGPPPGYSLNPMPTMQNGSIYSYNESYPSNKRNSE